MHSDGHSFNSCKATERLHQGESIAEYQPDSTTEATVRLGVTRNSFRRSHGIRLEVSSRHFPRIERNLNTGRGGLFSREMAIATLTLNQSTAHRPFLGLPVIPAEAP